MHIAQEQMINFNRSYPQAKNAYKLMQYAKIKAEKTDEYSQHVFCPSYLIHMMLPNQIKAKTKGLVRGDMLKQDNDSINLARELWGTHLFGTWRNTLGVYRINEKVLPDLVKSSIPLDTPSHIFMRVPHWCVYIETPDFYVKTEIGLAKQVGFWALLDTEDEFMFLNIVRHIPKIQSGYLEKSPWAVFQPVRIPILPNVGIHETMKTYYKSYYASIGVDPILAHNAITNDVKDMQVLLSILLWLCADEPDVSHMKEPVSIEQMRLPQTRKHPKTGVFIPPDKPIFYDIGERLGANIMQYEDKMKGDSRISNRKRPHIRKGHWHGYWRGTGESRQFKVRWQPAIFVNSRA